MNKQRALWPWILGALSVATIAVVVAVASSGKTITPGLHPAGGAVAQLTSTPDLPSTPAPAPVAAVPVAAVPVAAVPAPAGLPLSASASGPDPESAPLPAAPALAAAEPVPQTGQIWECMTNGVKTFSNNPCGEKSTLLEVRAINTMNPTPVVRYARAYAPEPRNSPAYADPNSYSDQDDVYGEQGAAEAPGNSYSVVQGFAFLPRKRPEHPHRPMHHHPGPPPRRN
jgi:hypothetical protein